MPNGWSVRQMWRANGVPELYVHDQDREIGSCGTQYTHQGSFKYQRGIWYRVDLYVKMNTHPLAADGEARLYIDGQQRAYAPNLRLAGLYNGTFETMIDAFGINTIYGGNDTTWSPTVPTIAYFDNFTVRSGLHVTGTRGPSCEIFDEGTLSHSGGVCCDDSCGACGGTGCSSLPGGASSCCTGTILSSGRVCTQSGISAPCYF